MAGEDAAERVFVDWEELEPVTDMRTALDPATPVIHPGLGDNLAFERMSTAARAEFIQKTYVHLFAAILGFIGIKLVLHALHENNVPFINDGSPVPVIEISTLQSLVVIIGILVVTVFLSLHSPKGKAKVAISRLRRRLGAYLNFPRPSDPAYKHLSPADWKQLQETLSDTPFAFIRPATAEDAPYGVQPGQPVLDEARLRRYVEKFAAQVQKGARIAKSATEAAKFNAKTTSTTPVARAPRAMAAVATAPALNGKQQSDQALREWMNRPGLDWDDE